jgi:glucose/arabinose dehydrogenase
MSAHRHRVQQRTPSKRTESACRLRLEPLEDRNLLSPMVLDPNLGVKVAVSGLDQPTSMAFLGPDDFFVLEKATGKVQHVVGQVKSTVLDLTVNNSSERGLLGIALHPDFAQNPFVYLYWTASTTGADSGDLLAVPLLGNRVDRFRWTGTNLVFDQHIISLRAFQQDAGEPIHGNHDGGVLRFGPDGKLYIIIGDVGRRGLTQNNLHPDYSLQLNKKAFDRV